MISDDELLKIVKDMQSWLGKSQTVKTTTSLEIKLITADGMEIPRTMIVQDNKIPDIVEYQFKNGRGKRVYQRDFSRDYDYIEVTRNTFNAKTPFESILKDFAHNLKAQGYNEFTTIHISKPAFNKLFRELSGKEPKPDITYMQLNLDIPIFIRYAPEKDKEPKLILSEDLKKLTLKQVIDLKLAQEKV